jgi:hypothetical protein
VTPQTHDTTEHSADEGSHRDWQSAHESRPRGLHGFEGHTQQPTQGSKEQVAGGPVEIGMSLRGNEIDGGLGWSGPVMGWGTVELTTSVHNRCNVKHSTEITTNSNINMVFRDVLPIAALSRRQPKVRLSSRMEVGVLGWSFSSQ